MWKKTLGLCMVLLACLLGLVSLLGGLGLFVSEKSGGRLSSVVVFLAIAAGAGFLLRFGARLALAKTPVRAPGPGPEAARKPEPTGHPPMQAPFSPAVAFPTRKSPEPYRPVHSEESRRLVEDLLALNRDDIPFRIVDGRDEGVDLIAEWRIVDAEFYALFASAGVRRVFRIYMKLDPDRRTVRTKDQEYGVRWNKGVPTILEGDYFQGQKFSMRWHAEIGLRKDTKLPGVVVNYTSSTAEMKRPIKAVVKAAGWRYKGLVFGKL